MNADRYTPIGPDQIPTGEIAPVEGTPLDFRQVMPIGARLHSPFQQMVYARGYDHNFVLNKPSGGGMAFAQEFRSTTLFHFATDASLPPLPR